MVLPVILPAQITSQARRWRAECLAQWGKWTHPLRHLVGSEVIVSPEDGLDRKVALYLSTPLPAAAFTCLPDATDKAGVLIAPPGYYSIHIERTGTYTPQELLAIILHELTHTVDPAFVSDTMAKKHWPAGWLADVFRHYALASEQRAFTAMWMEELRDYLASGLTPDINDLLRRLMGISWEFRGFFNNCPQLHSQISDHFNAMATYIRKELVMNLGGMSTPGLLKMHSAIREALEIDDVLHLAGLPKTYGVRDFADWMQWANALEAELDQRGVKYAKVAW